MPKEKKALLHARIDVIKRRRIITDSRSGMPLISNRPFYKNPKSEKKYYEQLKSELEEILKKSNMENSNDRAVKKIRQQIEICNKYLDVLAKEI